MNRIVSVLFVCLFAAGITAQANSIYLKGIYHNKNLYVQNPESDFGFGFSVKTVRINDDIYSGQINSSAFEIDFSKMGLKKGDNIEVLIEYEGENPPKLLNQHCIQPESTYKTTSIDLNEDGLLTFETKNESGSLPFVIEHYRWNKWNKIGEINGTGKADVNVYEFKTILHSGENIIRVTQKRQDGSYNISPTVKIDNNIEPVTLKHDRKSNLVRFSSETFYEVHNAYGILLKKGFGSNLDLTNLKKQNFLYISYDNTTESFKP